MLIAIHSFNECRCHYIGQLFLQSKSTPQNIVLQNPFDPPTVEPDCDNASTGLISQSLSLKFWLACFGLLVGFYLSVVLYVRITFISTEWHASNIEISLFNYVSLCLALTAIFPVLFAISTHSTLHRLILAAGSLVLFALAYCVAVAILLAVAFSNV